jgi:hypothetical protein
MRRPPKKGRSRIEDRGKTIEARKPCLKLEMSRRTWYRRKSLSEMRPEAAERAKALANGRSLRQIAEALKQEGFVSTSGSAYQPGVVFAVRDRIEERGESYRYEFGSARLFWRHDERDGAASGALQDSRPDAARLRRPPEARATRPGPSGCRAGTGGVARTRGVGRDLRRRARPCWSDWLERALMPLERRPSQAMATGTSCSPAWSTGECGCWRPSPSTSGFFQKARLRPPMPSFRINPIASWRSFAPSRCA